jgi:serine phosphatase RsbU (regulator of sigma subunit)
LIETSINIEDLIKQQKELEQSVIYASYIQKALLPSEQTMKRLLPNHFIFYLPRDLVSGDFYWVEKFNEKTIIAVGDCTGHGVPGALLSVLGVSFLNLVLSKHKPENPGVLLDILREYIMKALNQTGQSEDQKDGIDLSICMIDFKTMTLEFSGSFNPVYVIRKNKLTQIQGSKMPVGVAADIEEAFITQQYNLKRNDTLYLFSDGFPDQFGGPEGKKYKYPAFRELLTSISNLPITEQAKYLGKELKSWMGDTPQLDDITILGFKIL